MFLKFLATAVLSASLPFAVQAGPIQFNLNNFNFVGGGSALGSFVYDPVLLSLISSSIYTTAGSVFTGESYFFDSPAHTGFRTVLLVSVGTGFTAGTPLFNIGLGSPMTTDYATTGGRINITGAIEGSCSNANCDNFAHPSLFPYRTLSTDGYLTSAGTVSGTPEPASVWLFGSALLATGGYLRRRQAAATHS